MAQKEWKSIAEKTQAFQFWIKKKRKYLWIHFNQVKEDHIFSFHFDSFM